MKYKIQLDVKEDCYEAKITIITLVENLIIEKNEIIDFLNKHGIIYGILDEAINEIVNNPYDKKDVLVAKGSEHINGEDGEIIYKFDFSKQLKPTLNEDGSVDYKNMNYSISVKKGDIIAERTLPTESKDGINIYGKLIQAKKGKIPNFKYGINVDISEDGLKIYSLIDGFVKKENSKISVNKELRIEKNVGIETGNINFDGDVIVFGSINSGYEVECSGDLIVEGIVENAKINVLGNMIVQGGIQSRNNSIKVGGNLITKFISNANLEVNGSIETDVIMHSDIVCYDFISLKGKTAKLVGGNVNVRRYIEANTIGTSFGTYTKVVVAEIEDKNVEFIRLELDSKKNLENLEKLKELNENLSKKNNLDFKSKTELLKTQESIKTLEEIIKINNEKIESIKQEILVLKNAYIKAGEVFLGVDIELLGTQLKTKEVLEKVYIKCVANEIFIVNYEL